jgi:hypothetical protein
MKIALDYDGTFTLDPMFWDRFAQQAIERGHSVTIVTMRYPDELITGLNLPIVYTSRQAKMRHFNADIWIDDNPRWLLHGAA